MYSVCTKVIFISKRSHDNGEPKNLILVSVQKAHLAVRTFKVPGFMQRRIRSTVRICGNLGLPFAMVPCLHQSNIYIKRKLRQWRAQKRNPCFSAKAHLAVRTFKIPGSMQRRTGSTERICGYSGLPFAMVPCLHQSNIYVKGSYDNGEPKHVFLVSVQKDHLAIRTFKVPGSMQRRIGPTVRICGISGLPFAMAPCLHQSNISIKRKLRQWGAQKCIPCFSAKSPPRGTGLQSTRFHSASNRADSANLRDFGATFRHCTVFAPR